MSDNPVSAILILEEKIIPKIHVSAIGSPGGNRKRVTNIIAQHIIRKIGILNRKVTSKFQNCLMELTFCPKACHIFRDK